MKEFILTVIILIISAVMFTFIFQSAGDGYFLQTFFVSLIFSFSIGFINIFLFELIFSRIKNSEAYIRILLSIPLFIIGSFTGLIFGNYICSLLFGPYPFSPDRLVRFGFGISLFSMIIGSVLIFRERSIELKKQTKIIRLEATIRTLQAQINPHFFFNSLASIQSLIHKNPEKAAEALAAISEVFRYSMRRGQKNFIELKEEIEFIKQFLFIEKIRMGKRLNVIWDIDKELLDCSLPPFLIQPIVENAVKYGVERGQKGNVKISVKEENNKLNISVLNTGKAKVSPVPDHSLYNIKRRIEILYGTKGSLEINTNGEVKVEILIPKQYNKEKEG
jgi:sensor histidine kinase YesM